MTNDVETIRKADRILLPGVGAFGAAKELLDASGMKEALVCRAKEGVPYLRFYKDHEGWWNARSYVVSRIEKALKG